MRDLLKKVREGIAACEHNDGCLAVDLLALIDAALDAPDETAALRERVAELECLRTRAEQNLAAERDEGLTALYRGEAKALRERVAEVERQWQAAEESARMYAERGATYAARVATLEKALATDEPWCAASVLDKLADATDHLLRAHDCDAHGWEGVTYARDAARRISAAVRAALAAPATIAKPIVEADPRDVTIDELRARVAVLEGALREIRDEATSLSDDCHTVGAPCAADEDKCGRVVGHGRCAARIAHDALAAPATSALVEAAPVKREGRIVTAWILMNGVIRLPPEAVAHLGGSGADVYIHTSTKGVALLSADEFGAMGQEDR